MSLRPISLGTKSIFLCILLLGSAWILSGQDFPADGHLHTSFRRVVPPAAPLYAPVRLFVTGDDSTGIKDDLSGAVLQLFAKHHVELVAGNDPKAISLILNVSRFVQPLSKTVTEVKDDAGKPNMVVTDNPGYLALNLTATISSSPKKLYDFPLELSFSGKELAYASEGQQVGYRRGWLVSELVYQISVICFGLTDTVQVDLPGGVLEKASAMGVAGDWQGMSDALRSIKRLDSSKDEAFRLYAIGLSAEALAFQSTDPMEISEQFDVSCEYLIAAHLLDPYRPRIEFNENVLRTISSVLEMRPDSGTVPWRKYFESGMTIESLKSFLRYGMDEHLIERLMHESGVAFSGISPDELVTLRLLGASAELTGAMVYGDTSSSSSTSFAVAPAQSSGSATGAVSNAPTAIQKEIARRAELSSAMKYGKSSRLGGAALAGSMAGYSTSYRAANRPLSLSWPPPASTGRETLPLSLTRIGTKGDTSQASNKILGDIDRVLLSALRTSGYLEYSYYEIPGGFAIATRMEQVDEKGKPLPPPDRWTLGHAQLRDMSMREWARSLFVAKPGFYRVIVFVVSDRPLLQESLIPTSEEAKYWVLSGSNALPQTTLTTTLTDKHLCHALIYEFERGQGEKIRFMGKEAPDVTTHLKNAGLWSALSLP